MSHVESVKPFQANAARFLRRRARIEQYIEFITFENAVWLAGGVVAAAFIKERRHFFTGTFLIPHTESQGVRLVVKSGVLAVLLPPILQQPIAEVEVLLARDENL